MTEELRAGYTRRGNIPTSRKKVADKSLLTKIYIGVTKLIGWLTSLADQIVFFMANKSLFYMFDILNAPQTKWKVKLLVVRQNCTASTMLETFHQVVSYTKVNLSFHLIFNVTQSVEGTYLSHIY